MINIKTMTNINFSKRIVLFWLNIIYLGVQCQTSETDLHKKYWYYKSRFNNDFISIGTNSGQSIPFNQRGFNEDYTYTAPTATLKTGDGTVQLGIYIGVLATEYRLLKDKGQFDALPRVKHELFCALNAVNRLDYYAEQIISARPHALNPNNTTLSPSLNGFFVRDDIPDDFVKNHYSGFNYYNQASGYNGIGPPPATCNGDKGFTQLNQNQGVFETRSSYQSFHTSINPDWNSSTIPKVIGLLEGMEESQEPVSADL